MFNVTVLQAQITKPVVKLPEDWRIRILLDNNLHLEIIKGHIKNRKYCYTLQLSSTVFIPPKNPQQVREITGRLLHQFIITKDRTQLRS